MQKVKYPSITRQQRNTMEKDGSDSKQMTDMPLHPLGCGDPECSICQSKLDFLLVRPHCHICHGHGFIYPRRGDGSPDYSHVKSCPAPGCYHENWQNHISNTLTINQIFDSFNCGKSKKLKEIWQAAVNFAGETGHRCFVHFGHHGCGKTHLLHAIYNDRLGKGKQAKKFAMNEMFYLLQQGMKDDTLESKFAEIISCEMLLLDDLAMDKLTDWKLERLEDLLDYRIQNLLWTHITTNDTMEDIEKKSRRIEDRLGDINACLCLFNEAKSYRTGR